MAPCAGHLFGSLNSPTCLPLFLGTMALSFRMLCSWVLPCGVAQLSGFSRENIFGFYSGFTHSIMVVDFPRFSLPLLWLVALSSRSFYPRLSFLSFTCLFLWVSIIPSIHVVSLYLGLSYFLQCSFIHTSFGFWSFGKVPFLWCKGFRVLAGMVVNAVGRLLSPNPV